jgi:flagellar biosynthesis protein FliR
VDQILPALKLDALGDQWLSQMLLTATHALFAFTLVATRLTGLFLISPIFGHPDIPLQIRVLLVAAVSLLITPALLSHDAQWAFDRLDGDRDGRLYVEEASPPLHRHLRQLLSNAGKNETDPLLVEEFQIPRPAPATVLEYAWLGLVEFAVGLAMGLGALTVLSGLQMAGNLIDQQIGISLGEIFNPEFEVNATLSGQMLHQLGLMVFLIVGGHFLLVSALLDTFQTLPVGYAWVCPPMFDMLRDLVHQSLLLALQVSAPIMATMAVVGIAMGFLGHTIPQVNVLVIGFPIRTLVGLLLIGLSLPVFADIMGSVLPETIMQLRRALMGFSSALDP